MTADGTAGPVSGRRVAVAVATLVAVGVVVAGGSLVAADGNHLSVRPQVVAEGELLVESTFTTRGDYLVVHRDDGGRPGEPVGHVEIDEGASENVRVGLDETVDGETTLWVVLHDDDGDGEFDPEDDPALESFGSTAGRQVPVRSGDRPAYVSAPSESLQSVADGTVRVDRVAAAEAGQVVLRTVEGGDPGRAVGSADVPAGVSENVTVAVDEAFVEERPETFAVYAVLATADGETVAVGGRPVSSRVSLRADDGGVNVVTGTTGDDGDGESDGGVLALPGAGIVVVLVALAALVGVTLRTRED
jgi:hypothetical protein